MSADDLRLLQTDLDVAEADVARLRKENAELAERFRTEPTDAMRELLKRGAASLAAARDRVEAAKVALEIVQKTGSPHGLLAKEGRVVGSVAVAVPAGASSVERGRVIEAALSAELTAAAAELGVVLGATPERYTRERSGRDAEGRTILDVAGRVEGDVLVPAVSKTAKIMRS